MQQQEKCLGPLGVWGHAPQKMKMKYLRTAVIAFPEVFNPNRTEEGGGRRMPPPSGFLNAAPKRLKGLN